MTKKKKRRIGLATQVFIGLGLGILTGIFFGEEVAFLKLFGDAFIGLLQITVIPYVIVALITSIGRLTIGEVKTLSIKAGSILLLLWAVGLVVVLPSSLAFPNWPSASFFSVSQIEEAKPVDFLQLYIPSNVFFSLSNAIVPAIVVFSILFGIALINVNGKERFLNQLTTMGDALMGITGFVGNLAPYGVFAITASAAGTIGIADLGRLQVYVVTYVLMALILSLWLIPMLIAAVTPLRYGAILRTFRGPMITAFATGNLLIVLPLLAADSKELLERAGGDSDQATKKEDESSVDILIPAAFPFPSLGTVLALMFVLFGGWYMGSAVSIGDYPTLTVAGLASLFGGTVLALPFLFDLLRLPADLFQVFVTVDVIGSRFGTMLAAMHLIAIALIGTYAMRDALVLKPRRLLRFAVISGALIAAALVGIRMFFTFIYVQPYTKDQLLAGLELIKDPPPHKVYREMPEQILNEGGAPHTLARIKERGILRVGYEPEDYPSAFFNSRGELVGFDIEMMYRFAEYLEVFVEFVPIQPISRASELVDSGYCDIFGALLPIMPRYVELFAMTSPVLSESVGLIVPDYHRHEFRRWDTIREKSDLRIGISDIAASRSELAQFLPNATVVPYRDKMELDAILAAGAPGLDAVIDQAEGAAAWTIRHPEFNLVIPTPTFILPQAYSVAKGNTELLLYLDTWLLNARMNGTVDALYRYWMLGEVKETQPPRWSVIRDVLGWID